MEQNLTGKRDSLQEKDHCGRDVEPVAFQLNVKFQPLEKVEDKLKGLIEGRRCERGQVDDNDLVLIWTQNVNVVNDIIENRSEILQLLGVEKVLVGVQDSPTFTELRSLISDHGKDIKSEVQTKHTRFHYLQEVTNLKEVVSKLQIEKKLLQEQLEEEKLKARLRERQYTEQTEELKQSKFVAKTLIEKDASLRMEMGKLIEETDYLKRQLQERERRESSMQENNEHEELDTSSTKVIPEEESGIISPHEVKKIGSQLNGQFGHVFPAWYGDKPVLVEKLVSPQKVESYNLRKERLIRRYQRSLGLRCNFFVEVFGYCLNSDEDMFWLIMECMPRGCLSDVLEDSSLTLTWAVKNQLALDVGRGICFLHSREDPLLLRNICCANILVSTDFRAKICNTGDVETTGTADKENPISPEPYQPPELLIDEGSNSFYNLEAEAYGFGKIMESIAKRRDIVNDWNVTTKLAVTRGERLTLPEDSPPQYRDATLELTQYEPSERLTVRDAVELLEISSLQPRC